MKLGLRIILLLFGILLLTIGAAGVPQGVYAQSCGAAGACFPPPLQAPCGLPGTPPCPPNPPPADTPGPTHTPRPTRTPSQTPSATPTSTLTAVVLPPCSSTNSNSPLCTPAPSDTATAVVLPPCSSTNSSSPFCTPTPTATSSGILVTGPNSPQSTSPIPLPLLLGVIGGIIIVCIFGLGLWVGRRGRLAGMGDGSISPGPISSPSDQFIKYGGTTGDAANQFQKADDQFAKFKNDPGPTSDAANPFIKE